MEDRYLQYTVVTNDGRTLAGLLAAEAGNSITLLGVDGVDQVIMRNSVKSVSSTSFSRSNTCSRTSLFLVITTNWAKFVCLSC